MVQNLAAAVTVAGTAPAAAPGFNGSGELVFPPTGTIAPAAACGLFDFQQDRPIEIRRISITIPSADMNMIIGIVDASGAFLQLDTVAAPAVAFIMTAPVTLMRGETIRITSGAGSAGLVTMKVTAMHVASA
jgi:hypothetical protein